MNNKSHLIKFILLKREIDLELTEDEFSYTMSCINDNKFISLKVDNVGYNINPRDILLIK